MDLAAARTGCTASTSFGHILYRPHGMRCRSPLVFATGGRDSARRQPSIPADDDPETIAAANRKAAGEKAAVVLPRTGYLSLADPKAEVYSRVPERFDPAKKGGRWKPEFIWNTNWQEALAQQESLERQAKAAAEAKANAGPAAGDLGLSRLADLNNMDVDLSDALQAASRRYQEGQAAKREAEQQRAAVAAARASGDIGMSRTDSKKLARVTARSGRTVPSTRLVSSEAEETAARAAIAAAEVAEYDRLKVEFQVWTIGLIVVSAAATYSMYGREVTISYAVGALGGLVYLRLLGRSVDALGGDENLGARIAGAASQPRLLIPVGLALVFSRWNQVYADATGVHLQLLPILVGFFTYKIAIVACQAKEVLGDMSVKR